MATETHTIQWQRDIEAALAEAQRTHRPVLLDFTAAPQ
jgi:thiol:disulfide interchange protein